MWVFGQAYGTSVVDLNMHIYLVALRLRSCFLRSVMRGMIITDLLFSDTEGLWVAFCSVALSCGVMEMGRRGFVKLRHLIWELHEAGLFWGCLRLP
jgi:hypothetical protein